MRKKLFEMFIEKIMSFPLWVRQILYLRLARDMRANLCEEFIRTNATNILALYSPTLTFNGRNEFLERTSGLDTNLYNFLHCCSENFTMLDISLSTYLSMEEVSKYFVFCMEQGFVEIPKAKEVKAMAGFISGKYRIGEYFKERGTITDEQLSEAVNENNNNSEKFGETLLQMEFITQNDLKSLVILKEESQKRFIMDYTMIPSSRTTAANPPQDEDELKILRDENKKLKLRLENLLNLVKKDEE